MNISLNDWQVKNFCESKDWLDAILDSYKVQMGISIITDCKLKPLNSHVKINKSWRVGCTFMLNLIAVIEIMNNHNILYITGHQIYHAKRQFYEILNLLNVSNFFKYDYNRFQYSNNGKTILMIPKINYNLVMGYKFDIVLCDEFINRDISSKASITVVDSLENSLRL